MHERPDERMEGLLRELREGFNPPPATPRDEMWTAIQTRLESRRGEVVSLEEARKARTASGAGARTEGAAAVLSRYRRAAAWAGAAAALLVLGVGIGRMTAPGARTGGGAGSPGAVAGSGSGSSLAAGGGPAASGGARSVTQALRVAALEHLAHSESLLTLVRADARAGRMEPEVGRWAQSLLTQTRLLLDTPGGTDSVMRELLEDLELVLAQIVGVANTETSDRGRLREEMALALSGIDERGVLSRIQAAVPTGPRFAGS